MGNSQRKCYKHQQRLEFNGNVVFDPTLMLNKVPILKKKQLDDQHEIINGPIFLNADEFETLCKEQEEQEKAEKAGEQPANEITSTTIISTPSSTTTTTAPVMFSRESSVSIITDSSSAASLEAPSLETAATSTIATTSTATTCKASSEATARKEKQIFYTKNTVGYNVVFDANLMLNKVPILKQKQLNEQQEIVNGPIFLNADQYEALCKKHNEQNHKKPEQQQEEAKQAGEVEEAGQAEEAGEAGEQSIFSPTSTITTPSTGTPEMFSPESSVSIITDSSSTMSLEAPSLDTATTSTTVTTTSTATTTSGTGRVCKPSSGAIEWREKQIFYGKNTIGYKNFIKKYPNKELNRLNNSLLSTPDPTEQIGKKRWVGKYQKWRKFLHQFDNEGDDHNDDNQ